MELMLRSLAVSSLEDEVDNHHEARVLLENTFRSAAVVFIVGILHIAVRCHVARARSALLVESQIEHVDPKTNSAQDCKNRQDVEAD